MNYALTSHQDCQCNIRNQIYRSVRTENFDDYYSCRHKIEWDLSHVTNWLGLFVFMHNADILNMEFMTLVRLMGGERA